jgi:hypothetical protein
MDEFETTPDDLNENVDDEILGGLDDGENLDDLDELLDEEAAEDEDDEA